MQLGTINCESTWLGIKYANQVNSFFKAPHEKIKECTNLKISFLSKLSKCLPNITTFSEDTIDNVYNVFTRKVCNTRIQEFISSAKQQMASKIGLASTVDSNLRPILLAQHTKLETKFNEK